MDRWMHESLDIIAFGRSYWRLHKKIDEDPKGLGYRHRIYYHDWYWEFKKKWDFENPFPLRELDKAIPQDLKRIIYQLFGANEEAIKEASQAYIAHCYLDRIWDELGPEERREREKFCLAWIISPQLLYEAGIDVKKWRILVKKDNEEEWQDVPELEEDYTNLVVYLVREGILERLFSGRSLKF